MARRSPVARPAAPPPPSVVGTSPSEHIYMGSDELSTDPAEAARTARTTLRLKNPLRHSDAELTLYAEDALRVTERHNGQAAKPYFLDLRFLDPVPTIERVVAKRWLLTSLGCAAVAALAGFLLRFDAIYAGALTVVVTCGLVAAGALYAVIYRSYERIEFCTLHGRTTVLRLTANPGAMKRFRAAVPILSSAIEEAAERITADTAAYLRAEMRDHYRLRGQGVIDNDTCAAGTGRILAQFDVQL